MKTHTDAVELTRELVRRDTVNPPGNERGCARHLGDLLEAAGFAVSYHELAERRTSLVARRGNGSGKPLCLTGHIDTVPLGARAWRVDPFAGELDAGRLYGRGASDMKSGVAAFVAAAIDAGPRLERGPGVVVVITAGEETGCQGALHLAHLDGVLGEARAVVVGEPSANYPYLGHKGALWLTARSTGTTAHGSMPERGVNAVYKAAQAVEKLREFDFEQAPHPVLGKPTLNVGTITGGMNINSVPDFAEIGIDIRTLPGMVHAKLRGALTRRLEPEVAELSVLADIPGVWTEPDDPFAHAVFDVMEPLLGERPQPRGASYFTDASVLAAAYGGVPVVVLGPGEPEMAHQTDEFCRVERIVQAVDAYRALLERGVGA
ncbi:MAG: M20 family metallopeptidase [Gammaproteobacteria bacterium]|nr:M20 family metallopeptidase [Gammaproteobacteria bacterium]NIR81752.1 M20 family metallopeptidase [Gammaproteobacteria bacterium]NIR88555.1 M20 family metallopeptidase [Gammaproteobacteria bacterium]NIU02859.1 M20 family metallopeptidase [Gammaproteobacteria bacterium]NIV50381.1 ArgE/DapE family deacylase [Gammaproteobacteria bacterium]